MDPSGNVLIVGSSDSTDWAAMSGGNKGDLDVALIRSSPDGNSDFFK